jgi:hypothetical protein
VEALSSYTLACEFLGRAGGGVCTVPPGLRYESVSNILRTGGWSGSPAGVVPALQCLRLRVEQVCARGVYRAVSMLRGLATRQVCARARCGGDIGGDDALLLPPLLSDDLWV